MADLYLKFLAIIFFTSPVIAVILVILFIRYLLKHIITLEDAIKFLPQGGDEEAHKFLQAVKKAGISRDVRLQDKVRAGCELIAENPNITPEVKNDIFNQVRLLGVSFYYDYKSNLKTNS